MSDETVEEYITRSLRHGLNRRLAEAGRPLLGWCPICGDHHLPDLDCPMPLDEVVPSVGERIAEFARSLGELQPWQERVLVAAYDDVERLRRPLGGLRTGGPVLGMPVVVSEHVPSGVAFVVDPKPVRLEVKLLPDSFRQLGDSFRASIVAIGRAMTSARRMPAPDAPMLRSTAWERWRRGRRRCPVCTHGARVEPIAPGWEACAWGHVVERRRLFAIDHLNPTV